MSDLNDRIALVTGGSRGIGKAIALALAAAGATVAVNYRERSDEADTVTEAIHNNGGRAEAFGADVSKRSSVQSIVRAVEERLGPVDILINNAGMAATRSIDESPKRNSTAPSQSI
jgi:3-oxoacyl-[acyl-carrier protein] reductase